VTDAARSFEASTLRRSDLTKALGAVADSGFRVTSVEIDPAGKITLKVTGMGRSRSKRDETSEAAKAVDDWLKADGKAFK